MSGPLDRGWLTVACVASGPSLTVDQAAAVAAVQARGECRVIVVNNTWRMLPSADVLYAADDRWWRVYGDEARAAFIGEWWTNDRGVAGRHGLRAVRSILGDGLPPDPACIARGGNSGHQAIQLAARFGATRIVLVGYDMQRTGGLTHWHGDHRLPLTNGDPARDVVQFKALADDLAAAGVDVINATAETALPYFRRMALDEALA